MDAIPFVMPVAEIGMQLARSHTGTGDGPKEGVMTHDTGVGGHRAARDCVAAILAGS
ncbi:hypothetical protein [Paraburkholderia acidipaludis]|uniref:hypothetical protein n=1 Tax=Paraburkholderia acidipaludis TaxID=660537 RepID=UPI0012EC47B9|nr:hypothetical protein [Paraburkholderia acidipaludis]